MRKLLQRNNLWNDHAQNYHNSVVSDYPQCKSTSPPPPKRRVSTLLLHKSFDDVVCIGTVFRPMNFSTRDSLEADGAFRKGEFTDMLKN